jgi:hypothetical protein
VSIIKRFFFIRLTHVLDVFATRVDVYHFFKEGKYLKKYLASEEDVRIRKLREGFSSFSYPRVGSINIEMRIRKLYKKIILKE